MMDAARIVACEARHGLDALPVRDRDELGLGVAILAELLDAQRLLFERLDAVFVEVVGVLVGAGEGGAAAPDARDVGLLLCHGVCSRLGDNVCDADLVHFAAPASCVIRV